MPPPPLAVPGTRFQVRTSDGVLLRGVHHPGVAGGAAVVVGHGFTNSTRTPATKAVIDGFARHAAVYAADFRGHGHSRGRASVGRDEHLDLDAVVRLARADGYRTVWTVGFSMGASVVLLHAAQGTHRPDRVVAVSAPSRWFIRDTLAMRRVHWLLEHPLGGVTGRLIGVRLGTPWTEVPITPLEAVSRIAPIPLLLVHGAADHYFGPDHALALRAASHGHAQLWIEPGMTHAESATGPDLIDRIARWLHAPVGLARGDVGASAVVPAPNVPSG